MLSRRRRPFSHAASRRSDVAGFDVDHYNDDGTTARYHIYFHDDHIDNDDDSHDDHHDHRASRHHHRLRRRHVVHPRAGSPGSTR